MDILKTLFNLGEYLVAKSGEIILPLGGYGQLIARDAIPIAIVAS